MAARVLPKVADSREALILLQVFVSYARRAATTARHSALSPWQLLRCCLYLALTPPSAFFAYMDTGLTTLMCFCFCHSSLDQNIDVSQLIAFPMATTWYHTYETLGFVLVILL